MARKTGKRDEKRERKDIPDVPSRAIKGKYDVRLNEFEKSLLHGFINPLKETSQYLSPFGNAADYRRVYLNETEDEIHVTTDVAGADPDTLQIDVHGDHLHITGSIDHTFSGTGRYASIHDEFDRLVELPHAVDTDHIRAEYEEGILTVRMKKLARDIEA